MLLCLSTPPCPAWTCTSCCSSGNLRKEIRCGEETSPTLNTGEGTTAAPGTPDRGTPPQAGRKPLGNTLHLPPGLSEITKLKTDQRTSLLPLQGIRGYLLFLCPAQFNSTTKGEGKHGPHCGMSCRLSGKHQWHLRHQDMPKGEEQHNTAYEAGFPFTSTETLTSEKILGLRDCFFVFSCILVFTLHSAGHELPEYVQAAHFQELHTAAPLEAGTRSETSGKFTFLAVF